MKLEDAKEMAMQILHEEQTHPTVSYMDTWESFSVRLKRATDAGDINAMANAYVSIDMLQRERSASIRVVHEVPGRYKFASVNFDLLLRIYEQLNEQDRPLLVSTLLELIPSFGTAWNSRGSVRFPSWKGCFSCLPLVAEFCVRTQNTNTFMESLLLPKLPTTGLQIMLLQIAEMISVNFNIFSAAELDRLSEILGELSNMAGKQTWQNKRARSGTGTIINPDYKPGHEEVANAMINTIVGICEQCRKARYFYLKGALQRTPNIEISSDQSTVVGFLEKLGFSEPLIGLLNAAEKQYRDGGLLELKNSLDSLRTFLEHVHLEAAAKIAAVSGDVAPTTWDTVIAFLRTRTFITSQQEKFARGLHALISDEGAHKLVPKQEFARLLRHVLIEYGLLFLTALDKQGFTVPAQP